MIDIILLMIIGFGLACIIAIPIAILIYWSRSNAKKEAKIILTLNELGDPRKLERTMNILAHISGDLEAADLWHKLQALKDKKGG